MKESIIIAIIIIIIYIFFISNKSNLLLIETGDIRVFVRETYDSDISGVLLTELVNRMYILRDNMVNNKSNYPEYIEYIELMDNNFNKSRTKIYENNTNSNHTSYSVNKGEKIVFCLRDKKEGEHLVKENIMTFVAIHELGHLMTKSIGHEPEFWNSFKLLLKISIDHGLYKNINFNSTPKDYCGVKITDTPLKLIDKTS